MLAQEGRRFKRSLIGYNRSSVDSEFDRLIEQAESFSSEKQMMQERIDELNKEKSVYDRSQIKLNTQITSITGRVAELETSLSQAKAENETLSHAIEAHKAEKNAMQVRYEQLRERDRDYSLREREFAELQSSVSSIMSVTKRATDRLFQKSVENQERITMIAGDAAREVAAIRADMNEVREQLNQALDEVQDRIDRVDASLTGAVHKLVAIKHDDGLHTPDSQPDILSEVERLLSMRSGEVDYSDGKPYSAPTLGPYGAKFVADTAKRVSDGKISAKVVSGEPVRVQRAMPTNFESSDASILEASKLLERNGQTAGDFYASNPQFRLDETHRRPKPVPAPAPKVIGFSAEEPEEEPETAEPETIEPQVEEEPVSEESSPIVMPMPGADSDDDTLNSDSWESNVFAPSFDTSDNDDDDEYGSVDFSHDPDNFGGNGDIYDEGGMYVGDNVSAYSGSNSGFQYYPVKSYNYPRSSAGSHSRGTQQRGYTASSEKQPVHADVVRRRSGSPKRVPVHAVRNHK